MICTLRLYLKYYHDNTVCYCLTCQVTPPLIDWSGLYELFSFIYLLKDIMLRLLFHIESLFSFRVFRVFFFFNTQQQKQMILNLRDLYSIYEAYRLNSNRLNSEHKCARKR